MHWWDGGWHMGWMAFWWILALAAIALVVWAVLQAGRSRAGGGAGDSPEAILKRRYANGEIDRETYERMRADVRR